MKNLKLYEEYNQERELYINTFLKKSIMESDIVSFEEILKKYDITLHWELIFLATESLMIIGWSEKALSRDF